MVMPISTVRSTETGINRCWGTAWDGPKVCAEVARPEAQPHPSLQGCFLSFGGGGGDLPVPPPFGYRELLQSSMPGNICWQDKKGAAKHNLTSRAPSFSPGSQTNSGTFYLLLRPSLLGVPMANDDPPRATDYI